MASDYKDKIRKLLALAQSSNEHEAKAALLKARELMAEHKLTEFDLKDAEKLTVKDVNTGITCSAQRNPWIVNLSAVIGENYCCKGYRNHTYRGKTQYLGFVGLEDDVEICVTIFKYAVDCVLSHIKEIKREYDFYGTEHVRRMCDSYGYGFVNGVSAAFQKQQEEKPAEWGLVLVMPKEVEEATTHWRKGDFKPKARQNIRADMWHEGYSDGTEFDPAKRLEGTC